MSTPADEWISPCKANATDSPLVKFANEKSIVPFLAVVHEEFDSPASPARFVHADVFTSLDFARTWPHLFRSVQKPDQSSRTLMVSTSSSTSGDSLLGRWSAEWIETERQYRQKKGDMTGDLAAQRLDSFGRATKYVVPSSIATFMELVLPHGSLPVMLTLRLLSDHSGCSMLETVLKLFPALKNFDYPGSIVDTVLAALEPIDTSRLGDPSRLEPMLEKLDDNDFCRVLRLRTSDGRTLLELWCFTDIRTAPKIVRRFTLLTG